MLFLLSSTAPCFQCTLRSLLQKIVALFLMRGLLSGAALRGDEGFYAGLNLPPHQGSSGTGAFMPGVYNYQYTSDSVARLVSLGFSGIRLPVNIETACNASSLAKLKEYVDAMNGRAVLCMFGTDFDGDGHGSGKVDDVAGTADAWARLHKTFGAYDGVKYEIFNEPFGYATTRHYFRDVMTIINTAGLPHHKCIVAGAGYESRLHELVDLGWTGNLGYHIYPTWLADGERTQEAFSAQVQRDLENVSSRVWVTEFGAELDIDNANYSRYEPSGFGGDVNCLRGLHDALAALKAKGEPVRGAFHWHGWENGDSYDLWYPPNINGASKVRKMLHDLKSEFTVVV